ncbi:MAG: tRNA 2-selenouridine(34) synthase MnmH [Paucibacter sp.]|nr:tRNA 2-selenouridine(34) synthase MnmH [Roseateles sp.]
MSHRTPVRPADLARFDAVIDVRSPSEFALDHIPGAINCPVLDDEERARVGTIYVQQSAFEARRIGGPLVAMNIARAIQQRFADMPERWRPAVYCWRGGMRSGAMVTVMRQVGWDAQQLAGGYKAYRRHVVDMLEQQAPKLELRVLCGPTGSAKTRVLQALAEQGAQVLDLEAWACHKGSLLGELPGQPQPSQKAFETRLGTAIAVLDPARPVFIEAESSRIGRLSVPRPLLERLRDAPCIELQAPREQRVSFLLRDYAELSADAALLAERLGALRELHGAAVIEAWKGLAASGRLTELVEDLLARHYDPHYSRSQEKHLRRWNERRFAQADDLSQAGIAALAAQLLAS